MRKKVDEVHDLRDLIRRECVYLFDQLFCLA
jgi:hypothetical protein